MKKFFNLCWSIILLILLSSCAFGEDNTKQQEGTMVDDLLFTDYVYTVKQATNTFIKKVDDCYVKTNHVGNVNITGALSVDTGDYGKSFDTYWGEIQKLVIGTVRPGFIPGPRTLSAGLNTTAHGEGSVALGVRDQALEDHKFSFVWSGINGDQYQPYYLSHGVGTFNINPIDELDGFYIGPTNLSYYLNNASTLPFNITVSYPVGKYETGDTLTNGTPFSSIFKNMLRKWIDSQEPSFRATPNGFNLDNGLIEYNSQLPNTVSGTLTYNKQDGGTVTNFSWKLNNTQIASLSSLPNPLENVSTSFNNILDSATSPITATFIVNYQDGPQLDEDYTPNPVPAGSKSSSFTLTPARYRYYAPLPSVDNDITASDITNLVSYTEGGKKLIATTHGNFTINCPIGTAEVVFALPTFFAPNVSSVYFENSISSNNIMDKLTSTTVFVPPENGRPASGDINKYKVMVFKPDVALQGTAKLTIFY